MKELGKTYRAVKESNVFSPEETDCLFTYIRESFMIADNAEFERLLDSSTDDGEYASGNFYMLEDLDDIHEMLLSTGCDNITEELDYYLGFDVALYLNKTETTALLSMCTNDQGGDLYIVPSELFEQYPSIHTHIFKANQC